jgi:hypothetical protein
MTVISPAIDGYTAMPFTGTPRCGYMRSIHHHCKDTSCPLNSSLVMVLASGFGPAIEACSRLWDTRDQQLVAQRFTVLAKTLQVNNEDLEEGLLRDSAESWTHLRAMVEDHERPVIHLSNIGALLSRAGSPGNIWVPQSPQLQLPKNARPGRPDFEDLSWLESDLDLDSPDSLIDDGLDEPFDGLDEPSEGL